MSIADQYPDFWRKSPETLAIWESLDPQLLDIRSNLADIIAQCDVETATWGLSLWEAELGIPEDVSKLDTDRRALIKSKLRGTGTVTKAMIQNAAEAFSNGEVAVDEYPEEFRFVVRFVGSIGIPPNMDDFKTQIDGLKPAHLVVAYEYMFALWREWQAKTWGQVATKTWSDLREEVNELHV